MKARVKATGEIVHVRPYSDNRFSVLWKDIYRNINYADCELDFEVTDKDEIYNKGWADGWNEAVKSEIPKIYPKLKDSDPDYWTRLEHQYAGMAMQGICANYTEFTKDNDGTLSNTEMIVENARLIAHVLVEKMKENEKAMH